MIRPYCWELHHYIESMLWWCECEENKSKKFYYFPITRKDIENEIEFVNWAYERNMPAITALSKIDEKKKNRNGIYWGDKRHRPK